jgi:hypothetical protein
MFEQLQSFERIPPREHHAGNLLRPSNKEMLAFSSATKPVGPVQDREQDLFNSGFSFDQVPSIYGNSDNIASNPSDDYKTMRDNAFTTDIVRQIKAPNVAAQVEKAIFPQRGQEDVQLAKVTSLDPEAWENAIKATPSLAGTGVSAAVLKGLVRNELHFFDPKDAFDDKQARSGKVPAERATLGFVQISQKGISEFERDIPEFKKFLESKGYTGPKHEIKALEDPTCAPMIVAAKLASLAKSYEKHNKMHPDQPVQVDKLSLIYGYNADVQARSEGGRIVYETMPDAQASVEKLLFPSMHKVYPTSNPVVLNTSRHVANVLEQIQIIESQHN